MDPLIKKIAKKYRHTAKLFPIGSKALFGVREGHVFVSEHLQQVSVHTIKKCLTEYIIVRVSNRTYLATRCDLWLVCNALFLIKGYRIRGLDVVSFKKAIVYLLCSCAAVQTYGACTSRSVIMRENVLWPERRKSGNCNMPQIQLQFNLFFASKTETYELFSTKIVKRICRSYFKRSYLSPDITKTLFLPSFMCFVYLKPQLRRYAFLMKGHLITVPTLSNLMSILCHIDLCFYFCSATVHL